MLLNNLDPEVAEHPERLVVYGGSGRAARSPEALRAIVSRAASPPRGRDAARPERQARRGVPHPRGGAAGPDRERAARATVGDWDEFRRLEALGLTMYGQMTAGSWIYIGTQGILQGTYQTFAAAGEKHFGSPDLAGRTILTAGLGGMGGAQPLAATMAGAAILCVEVDPSRIRRRLDTGYLDEWTDSLDDALARVRNAAAERRALSVGLLGNAAEVVPELVRRGERFDLVTDQTAAHDPLNGYIPAGVPFEDAATLRRDDPERYLELAGRSIAAHVEGLVAMQAQGAHVFDYGNNLRGEAQRAGYEHAFDYPGFVAAYVRPLFCRGIGPFRWAALSGEASDIAAIDDELRRIFPDDALLQRWLSLAPGKVAFQGLPARICWLGYGDRAKAGLAINELDRLRPGLRSGRDRARPPRRRLRRLAVPGDRGDGGRLGRDRRLADPQRSPQYRGRGDLGQRPPRRRRRHRQLDPRRDGRPRRRERRRGIEARARAHLRPRHRRDAPRRRRLRRGARGRPRDGPRSAERADVRRLLVRDLRQLATPAGDAAPASR